MEPNSNKFDKRKNRPKLTDAQKEERKQKRSEMEAQRQLAQDLAYEGRMNKIRYEKFLNKTCWMTEVDKNKILIILDMLNHANKAINSELKEYSQELRKSLNAGRGIPNDDGKHHSAMDRLIVLGYLQQVFINYNHDLPFGHYPISRDN